MSADSTYQDFGHGITAIDTGFVRPRFDAAYLVAEGGRGAFVDTGTNEGLPRLMGALDRAGLCAKRTRINAEGRLPGCRCRGRAR